MSVILTVCFFCLDVDESNTSDKSFCVHTDFEHIHRVTQFTKYGFDFHRMIHNGVHSSSLSEMSPSESFFDGVGRLFDFSIVSF